MSSWRPRLFGTTILWSACLLFLVQPLISKLILPWFGGSASVWITALLFFQAALLLGYAYAHALARKAGIKPQAIIHIALLILSLAWLPILPRAMWQPQPGRDPMWLVFGVLAASVGLPYVLLSATSPLLQNWYAQTDRGALPYRYFALSNAGSLAALLAYPVLIEPYLTGHEQAWTWSIAFALFAVLCVATAALAGKSGGRSHIETPQRIATSQVFLWIGLAGSASTLLLVVTSVITQNIAPMPLLWVIPLGIYLVTFVLSFESARWYRRVVFLPLVLPAIGCMIAGAGRLNNAKISVMLPLLCVALFVCSMACHGELARSKPAAPQLTTFYLAVAAGGALGGFFVALLAPRFFNAMYEYPIAFVACVAILLAALWRDRLRWTNRQLGFAFWMAGLAATFVMAGYLFRETWRKAEDAFMLKRNFYGALRVDEFVDRHSRVRQLTHGTITHGLQFRSAILRNVPTTYYARDSGIGRAWRVLERSGPLRMGIIGLGTGTLAAYGRGGDALRFYEINPLVVQIARTEFTFLSDCPAHIDVVLGDARLSMAREPSQRFDILVVDAFSGDAIPVHLFTREAFAIYWRHLKPDGVLAVHTSNRYLKLAPVVMLAAKALGKQTWEVDNEDDDEHEVYSASYVLVTNRPHFFEDALFRGQLLKIEVPPSLRAWTDDYSNLWQSLQYRKH